MLGRRWSAIGEALSSENLPEVSVTFWCKDYFSYRHVVSEVTRHPYGVTSPRASDSTALDASPDYYVNVDGEADGNLEDLNVVDDPLEHTVLKMKYTELQEACRRADVVVSPSMVNVVGFAAGRVTVIVASRFSSNDLFRRPAEVYEFQTKYDGLVLQLNSMSSEGDTFRPLA